MSIYFKDTKISKIYKGASEIKKIYRGTVQLYSSFPESFRYLIVAGGGGGGMDMGGGAGAGGYLAGTTTLTPQNYNITVGAGGSGAPAAGTGGQNTSHQYNINATNGGNSSFNNLTAVGGGYGGSSYYGHTLGGTPSIGGSGGGRSAYSDGRTLAGAAGTPGQGNSGGQGGGQYYSGGGGGAGGPGANSTGQPNGGVGLANDILGPNYFWAGGGGGSSYSLSTGGNGGAGGGGGGALGTTTGGTGLNAGLPGGGGSPNSQTNTPGGNAGTNTGGGGGGGSHYNSNNKGGEGGSGIVVIRYAGDPVFSGGTITTVGEDTVHTFTSSGTLTLTAGSPSGGGGGISSISALSYDSATSYTGDTYPGTRYGGTFFKVKPDGTRVFFTYADYNYHRDNYADLSTPWDFSTIGAQVASGNYDLTNHYQTTWWISQDGTKVFTGGYSNSNVAGYDDIYRKDLSTAWVNTGDSYTTYGTNPRTSWGAHTNYKMLGFNTTGTTWVMGSSNDAAGTNLDYRMFLRQYTLSTPWDQSSGNVTLQNFFDLGAAVGITSYYSGGTGEICGAYTMNYAGTQIILEKTTYSSSTITSRKFMIGNMSTPFDISTLTVDTSNYLELVSLPITANFNIADVAFGGNNQEYLIVGVGNGSYGQTNGVKWKWLTYK